MNWDKLAAKHEDLSEKAQITAESAPVFSPIVSDGFARFPNLPPGTRVASGTTLVEQYKRCSHVTLLLEGLVKLVSVNGEGKQATIGLRSAGWYAGAASVLMDAANVYSVVAVTPCTVVLIPADNFYFRLIQSARMMRHFISAISSETISLASAQVHIMSGTAEDRLTQFMSERQTHRSPRRVLDTLPLLKQSELAQLLAISPEHLSRLLHKVSGKGCIGRSIRSGQARVSFARRKTKLVEMPIGLPN